MSPILLSLIWSGITLTTFLAIPGLTFCDTEKNTGWIKKCSLTTFINIHWNITSLLPLNFYTHIPFPGLEKNKSNTRRWWISIKDNIMSLCSFKSTLRINSFSKQCIYSKQKHLKYDIWIFKKTATCYATIYSTFTY